MSNQKQTREQPNNQAETLNPKAVKAKVNQYRETKQGDGAVTVDTAQENRPPVSARSELEWNDLISNRIEEAMRNGAFDNLRNKGKPLPNLRNPYVPEDQQMANDLLKNNGLAPQWISDRTTLLHALELFRMRLQAVALAYREEREEATSPIVRNEIRDRWAEQIERWQDEMDALNKRINVVNLQQPIVRLEIFKLRLDDELKRANATRVL